MSWHSLPLFVRVAGRPVILVGDGEAADAKRRLLERAGAVVVADHPDARLAVVALEDEGAAVAAVAALKARGILVNAVDRPALCDFTLPAIVDRHPVLVAIGTGGVSAGLAAALRQRLEVVLPVGLGRLANALFALRERLRIRFADSGERRRMLARAMANGGHLDPIGPALTTLARLDEPMFLDSVEASIGRDVTRSRPNILRLASSDPDSLSLRQARLLSMADRVLHDGRVPTAILDRARADATRIILPERPRDLGPGLSVWVEMAP